MKAFEPQGSLKPQCPVRFGGNMGKGPCVVDAQGCAMSTFSMDQGNMLLLLLLSTKHTQLSNSLAPAVQARGKSGPLFDFGVHEDIRVVNDASREKNESHAGKVVERHWYDRNKHIFPASRWEVGGGACGVNEPWRISPPLFPPVARFEGPCSACLHEGICKVQGVMVARGSSSQPTSGLLLPCWHVEGFLSQNFMSAVLRLHLASH
eukprot:362750-Pelagomonas_calceolata.AAC.2